MAFLGDGVLLTFTEVPDEVEQDFNEWYNREHLDQLVNMPGFLRNRRYRAVDGRPKYFASYELRSLNDVATPEYFAHLADQTPWSQRMMAQLSHFHRMTCRIGIDQSHGIGGALTLIRLFPADEVKAPLRDWLRAEGLPAAIARPGLLGGALLENDLAIANAPATNQGMDDFPLAERQEWAILIDGAEWEPTRAAAIEVLGEGPLAEHGIDGDVHIASYQFLFGVSR